MLNNLILSLGQGFSASSRGCIGTSYAMSCYFHVDVLYDSQRVATAVEIMTAHMEATVNKTGTFTGCWPQAPCFPSSDGSTWILNLGSMVGSLAASGLLATSHYHLLPLSCSFGLVPGASTAPSVSIDCEMLSVLQSCSSDMKEVSPQWCMAESEFWGHCRVFLGGGVMYGWRERSNSF